MVLVNRIFNKMFCPSSDEKYGDDGCVDDERAVNIKSKIIRKSLFIFRDGVQGVKISNFILK